MANMLMAKTSRAKARHIIYCHDQCDPTMTPRNVKNVRRLVKRSENIQWRKDEARNN